MFNKPLTILSVLALAGACSHGPGKSHNVSHHPSFAKSFKDLIKGQRPVNPEKDKRFPAATANVPGMKEFVAAVKANPAFFSVPTGFEVIKESVGSYQGHDYKSQDKQIFLSENHYGSFSLNDTYEGREMEFRLLDKQRMEDLDRDLRDSQISHVQKVSATKYIITVSIKTPELNYVCKFDADLTKSSELIETSCKDDAGDLVSETKLISLKAINPKDYSEKLKSVKLVVMPNALECTDSNEDSCQDSVTDETEKDWSYLLK